MDLLRASSSQRAGESGYCAKADSVKSDVSWIRLSRYLSDGKPSFLNPAFESLKSVKKVLDNKKKAIRETAKAMTQQVSSLELLLPL